VTIANHVIFDWTGSLLLARRLWEVAERLEALTATRHRQAGNALVDWNGSTAVEFATRVDAECSDCARLSNALREEANGWATEWSKAVDEENWVRYQEACQRVRSQRGAMDKVGGFLFGHDDLPPEPRSARPPSSPGFAPTRKLADYSAY
jgi:hypothetical protein